MRLIFLLVLLVLVACARNPHGPDPSSDPLELLIESNRDDGFRHLYAISADGTALQNVTRSQGFGNVVTSWRSAP